MPNAKPTLFLDLDGPILDVSRKYWQAYRDTLVELGGAYLTLDDYWNLKRDKTPLAELLARTEAAGLAERFRDRWIAKVESVDYQRFDRVWAGVPDLLATLAEAYTIVLVTLRRSASDLHRELELLGIRPFLSQVLSSGDQRSPRWTIKYDLVQAAGLSCTPADAFVGDTETDILAGRHLKVRTAGVLCGIRTHEHLAACQPDMLAGDLVALAPWLLTVPNLERALAQGDHA